MFSQSEENYIKTIYHLALVSDKGITTNAIAKMLVTKASSVTDMIKKLSDKEVVIYKKYQGVTLTEFGQKTAANIIRKHRLWEVFLVEKLNFSWDEVHEVAEQLEHIQSPKLIDELAAFLGHPKTDPHGDPIPDKEGNLPQIQKSLLATLQKSEQGVCVGVNDTSSEFLRFLDKQEIGLGQHIEVLDKEPFDDSFLVRINAKEMTISNKVANNIYIQKK
ncbi:metal-dependent transcriptional regulator [Tenacibaculum finnmarkense genomovar finnmarkense]|uniref:Transcriptional regulator MntR n=1 Tax=Tenacibaculum finnmarkense genomovar finnmarkense TaxID=1458503 RepID=A0AAP1RH50_9FLAO|nr:metal-dependent transcriptional regulator [Tenacibaculum finnmarkense]MBE7653576.1 metal-dependent transcriptional regulator [Tenacibaculum finnmarkense genomovar finnmarkense]MBE7692839.1 metal-dependent transcriptional regulator [Tenacibaculum finnmarkense genomovar finnmarkense]MBE7695832.1 metal-dependent transcriptional regulator [Tenacibaculum finnmarkense genomovar finnmarkense]MCD8416633.1 metal-dependent transcriptional regulator [Tenacibaculum finnmarkense genomovar finnmarkense]M